MDLFGFVMTVLITAIVVGGILTVLHDMEVEYLTRENRMLWRLLSDQAKLHEMSLGAYIAMLQSASSRAGR